MRFSRTIFVAALLCFAFFGCQEKEGPAERLGKQIDQSVDAVGSKFEDVLSETGKKLDEATEDLKKSVDSFGSGIKKATKIKSDDRENSEETETEETP